MADTRQRRETAHRGFFRTDGDDSKQRAVGDQQQGARKVRLAAAHQQRRLADAFRRAARAALGCAGDDLCRAIQRPPAGDEITPSSMRRRTAISTQPVFFTRSAPVPATSQFTRLRSNLKTVSIRCPTWRAKLTDSHGRWTARRKILLPETGARAVFSRRLALV